jgi:hypothetical protein
MWARKYKDYPQDSLLVKEPVEPGKGIVGCEMHGYFGWGEVYHPSVNPEESKKDDTHLAS